jgi:lipopolysaccharide export system protein LptA
MRTKLALLFVVALAALAGAQTNSTPAPKSQEIYLTSGRGFFDGTARVVVYYDHVVVTNAQGRLACERLTIHLPPDGAPDSHPTNAVAETNLDVFCVDNKGRTNHLVADKGIYAYGVRNGVTNETFTFGPHATNTTDEGWFTGEPLIWDVQKTNFDFGSGVEMHFKVRSDNSTSPFNMK